MTLPAQRPLAHHERSLFPDFLRGVALLGILLVNVHVMGAPWEAHFGPFRMWQDEANDWAFFAVNFFASASSYVLFAMLFGLGFHFLSQKRERLGPETGDRTYWRRLAVLAGFGGLHLGFLWFGDVLLLYALIGCVLPAFWRCREKTQLIWAAGLFVLPLGLVLAILGVVQLVELSPETAAQLDQHMTEQAERSRDQNAALIDAYANGGFGKVASARWQEYLSGWASILAFMPQMLGAMLLGLIFGKRGVLTSPAAHGAFFRRVLWVCIPVGLIGKALYAVGLGHFDLRPDRWLFWVAVGMCIGGPALTLVYVALLRLALLNEWWPQLRTRVVAAGRMPLTNYLMQSFITAALFHGYGLGLYGRVNIWQGVLLALGIYAVQLIVSPLWLRRFAFGPLEWIWRRLTYGPIQLSITPPPLPAQPGA